MHLVTIQALNSKHHVNQPLKYDLVVWENSISKSNGASPEHSPDFIANNYYTSWRTYFSHWYPAAVVRGIDSNCQFPAFSSTFRFCKGEKKSQWWKFHTLLGLLHKQNILGSGIPLRLQMELTHTESLNLFWNGRKTGQNVIFELWHLARGGHTERTHIQCQTGW